MDAHPFSEIWPLMSGTDYEELALDIAAHGLRVPIVLYQGKVLDGRNRERACLEAGVEPVYQQADVKTDDEALDLVISLNQHRRHLSMEERAFAAAKMANLKRGRPSTNLSKERIKTTIEEVAQKMDVSVPSLARAKVILKDGTADDVDDVVSKRTSLGKKAEEVYARKRASKASGRSMPSMRDRARFLHTPGTVKALSREQVDPEFQGSDAAFVDKYGHVVMHTAEERASIRFADWVAGMKLVAKSMAAYPNWTEVDHNWLRSPKERDVERLEEALAQIRGKVAEAEALLAIALKIKAERDAKGRELGERGRAAMAAYKAATNP